MDRPATRIGSGIPSAPPPSPAAPTGSLADQARAHLAHLERAYGELVAIVNEIVAPLAADEVPDALEITGDLIDSNIEQLRDALARL